MFIFRLESQISMDNFTENLHCFLLMGQSNMAGRGDLSEVKPITDERIFMFRDNHWQLAIEPLHQDRPEAGVGPAMSFASTLLKSYPDLKIGLIPCAVGATSISQWLPGSDLYNRAVNTVRTAGVSLQGVLWHQGEYDANEISRVRMYRERITLLIESIRRDLKLPQLPFIAGELGGFINAESGFPFSSDISAILYSLENVIPNYACVSAAGLIDNGDNLHFNAESQRTFGRRYARKYLQMWKG
ncbi:MAG: sialate O-acetylesterase [Candidatus Neomarinimicrobiota bacterium]|nr:MAG: sialate O-acetylesterase [Candidatus Neomarinimicrobiota bacterium]